MAARSAARCAVINTTLKLLKKGLGIGCDRVEEVGNHEVEGETVADQEHLELFRKGADVWNCWRDDHPEVMSDLRGVDLRGKYLSRFNLSQADLRGVQIVGDDNRDEPDEDGYGKLEGYNSSNADFSGANLRGANLSGLSFSNLGSPESEESFKSVDLRGADLTGANLSGCYLSGAKLGDFIIESDNWHLAEFRIEPYRREQTIIPIKLKDINLSGACLDGVNLENLDLSGANLSKATLLGADLRRVNLNGANLNRAKLIDAHLNGADLTGATLAKAELFGADLTYANLTHADLAGARLDLAHLTRVNFTGACLEQASLLRASLWEANLYSTNLTGACLEDWNTNSQTKLDDVICEYFYWKQDQQERRPSSGSFKPGEFAALFQKALETVDLIFVDGIDWKAFFASFQELQSEYGDDNLSIQALEKKRGGAFVIRLEVTAELDKAVIECQAKLHYERQIQQLEVRVSEYRDEVKFLRQSNTKLEGITQTMAEKENQPTNQTTIYNQTVGAMHTGSGDISHFTQNIGQNLNDITKLINSLRETAQAFPEAQGEETLGHLGDLEDDLKQPTNDRTPRRIKATLTALLVIAGMVAASTDFSNNVLEISNKLGIELIQPHKQQLPPSGK
ncbi:MAG: pentapeptide repeat-containing protein [Phormidesmis sp. CAN_BIN44]|nr:pentapeptide repeat-containing protein [Phormidesmis sp. CAN_BIN44]